MSDPQGRWPNAVFHYSGSNLPTKFSWLGRMGDGSIAYAGNAWRLHRHREGMGYLRHDRPGCRDRANTKTPSTPTLTQEPSPTQTEIPSVVAVIVPTLAASSTPIHPTATPAATPTPTIPIPTAVTAVPVSKPAPVSRWPAVFTGSLLVLFLSLSLLDPRPAAWRRLARIKSNPNPKS